MMSEQRFRLDYEEDDAIFIVEDDDIVYPIRNDTIKEYQLQKLVDKLNEQQAEIERLKEQLSLVCKAESSSPYNSVKEVLRRQIFGLDCAAQESANAWNHYRVLSKLFEEQYGEYWDNFD